MLTGFGHFRKHKKMQNFSNQYANYYELFGLDSKATQEDIKQAYIRKIKEWHPDKNPDRRQEAEEKTKILNQAYHLLSDPEGRKNYDRMLRFTRGRNFGEFINDEAIKNKINKSLSGFKKRFGECAATVSAVQRRRQRKV